MRGHPSECLSLVFPGDDRFPRVQVLFQSVVTQRTAPNLGLLVRDTHTSRKLNVYFLTENAERYTQNQERKKKKSYVSFFII